MEKLCKASIVNGYFGDRVICDLVLKGGKILAVYDFGNHRLITIDRSFVSAKEALWYLKNHSDYTSKVKIISEVNNETT
jgi:hypothetical protein